jgi:uncharacterized protein with HEPN domain
MSSSDPRRRVEDMLDQIDRLESHVAGMDEDAFRASPLAQDAVERCLERICEAARKIGDLLDQRYPDVDFPNLRRFGSILRHDYGCGNHLAGHAPSPSTFKGCVPHRT